MRQPISPVIAVIVAAALCGCSDKIVMKNPQTEQTTACAVTGISQSLVDMATEYCAKAYEKAGWTRATP
jgi:hypothetical protein